MQHVVLLFNVKYIVLMEYGEKDHAEQGTRLTENRIIIILFFELCTM